MYNVRILADNVLLRVSKVYTYEQVKKMSDLLDGELYSADVGLERENWGDELNVFHGEWECKKWPQYSWMIDGTRVYRIVSSEYDYSIAEKVDEYCFKADIEGKPIVCNQEGERITEFRMKGDERFLDVDNSTIVDHDYIKFSDKTTPPTIPDDPVIGMTEDEVIASSWGRPSSRNTTTTIDGIREQWVYRRGYLYFENGILTAIQE